MELLGARNWWIPAWLDRIVPRLSVEGADRPDDAPGIVGSGSAEPREAWPGLAPAQEPQPVDA
jgi:RND superfamily putative drug exporter